MAASSSRNAACRVLQSSHLSGVSSRRAVFPSKELLAGGDCHRSFSTSHSVLAKDDGKTQARGKGKGRASNNVRDDIRFNFNTSLIFTEDPNPEHLTYKRVTADDLRNSKEPPTKVKMLVRDFIDDSLYNPHYGYFSKNATIFSPPDNGYDFTSFADQVEFQETIAARYAAEYTGEQTDALGKQVWHTPTELFKPYFAQALVSAILSSYKMNHFPYQDLIIYELGAGNGSFMIDAMSYIKTNHPDVYSRTRYNIIEISPQLARRQRQRARAAGVMDHVEIIEQDFFKWDGGGLDPCYVVALEVLDNFAHDMIRYDLKTLDPLQAIVVVDDKEDFTLLYEPIMDPLIRRALSYRRSLPPASNTNPAVPAAFVASPLLRKVYSALPLAPNLSKPDFVPTKAISFLERLRTRLPQHRLLVADFDQLPDAVPGRTGPVVQTRIGGAMVPCETFLVKQGLFDIFFPTDFELLRDTYSFIMNSPIPPPLSVDHLTDTETLSHRPSDHESFTATADWLKSDFFSRSVRGFKRRQVSIASQADFMRQHGGEDMVKKLTTKDGAYLADRMYANAKVMF